MTEEISNLSFKGISDGNTDKLKFLISFPKEDSVSLP
jgi:hypothetical protein